VVLTVVVAVRHVPESRDRSVAPGIDVAGAVLGVAGLAGVTYALIEGPRHGFGSAQVALAILIGLVGMGGFALVESRGPHPMLPLDIFRSRRFTATNSVTFLLYAALAATFFLVVVQLQTVLGYSPVEAGAAMFPVTLLMLLLSARAGGLAQRTGPRLLMTFGALLVASGMLVLSLVDSGTTYLSGVLPGVLLLGLGLSAAVAPLTATVLGAVEDRHAGVASGVNNAVARVGGLLAVAILPAVSGLTRQAIEPRDFASGFRTAMTIAAALAGVSSVVAWVSLRREEPVAPVAQEFHCPMDAPPLRSARY
jgi:hypothetical protein